MPEGIRQDRTAQEEEVWPDVDLNEVGLDQVRILLRDVRTPCAGCSL